MNALPSITETKREKSPATTPQALAWHGGLLWIGSRDLRSIQAVDVTDWSVREEVEAPGIPWAAVSDGDALWFTLGEGEVDDRYLRRFVPGSGWADDVRIPCPDFTGSYLSCDGEHLYLSQWYLHRILKLDQAGNILQAFDLGAEICGHTFVDGALYVLRGTEQNGEDWRMARFHPDREAAGVEDLAKVPFPCRSLAWDGAQFWSNHRAADATVRFALP